MVALGEIFLGIIFLLLQKELCSLFIFLYSDEKKPSNEKINCWNIFTVVTNSTFLDLQFKHKKKSLKTCRYLKVSAPIVPLEVSFSTVFKYLYKISHNYLKAV